MPIKSGDKGKSYELKISKRLSAWCGFELIRTPMSGAWQGTAGDIKPKQEDRLFPFVIECKKDESWSMEQVLAGNGKFPAWLQQANDEIAQDAAHGRHAKSFMLIFSRNFKADYIAVPLTSAPLLPLNHVIVHNTPIAVVIYQLDDFITTITYDAFVASI